MGLTADNGWSSTHIATNTRRNIDGECVCLGALADPGLGAGAPCPQELFFKIVQFSGYFKGKTLVLSKFWPQGPPWGQNSAESP